MGMACRVIVLLLIVVAIFIDALAPHPWIRIWESL